MIDKNSKVLAEAVGGKTARACDGCLKRRARWYCAADDAFLCQLCDVSVHSANPLACRHERVRLKSASSSSSSSQTSRAATWHHGFTRKPRTPRGGSGKKNSRLFVHDLVPDIGIEDQTENYEELIYQVPVFDPFVSEKFRNVAVDTKNDVFISTGDNSNSNSNVESCLNGFFPTDKELAEFEADVETLLGRGLENESFAMEELGLVNNTTNSERPSLVLKVEEKERETSDNAVNNEYFEHDDVGESPFELSFDYDSHAMYGEELNHKNKVAVKEEYIGKERGDDFSKKENYNKKDLMLRLDYEAVMATWGGQGPPWMAGGCPKFDTDDHCWPACMGVNRGESDHSCGVGFRLQLGFADEGREARVTRYREKRRTRLFSKKIRYEVRKLNAEKRPRMKGRFVKRSAFAESPPYPLLAK